MDRQSRNDIEEGKVEHHDEEEKVGNTLNESLLPSSSSSEDSTYDVDRTSYYALLFSSLCLLVCCGYILYLIVGNEKSGLFDTTKTEFLVWCSVILGVAFVFVFARFFAELQRVRIIERIVEETKNGNSGMVVRPDRYQFQAFVEAEWGTRGRQVGEHSCFFSIMIYLLTSLA